MSPLKSALALAALVALAGCGKMGPLERPGPILGDAGAAPAAAPPAGQDPNRPVSTVDPRDRTTNPAPPRSVPIEGGPNDPNATAPQGALPDPFARPR